MRKDVKGMRKKITPRGLRNNNPGNIRINDDLFQGEVRPSRDKSFKQFETMAYGYRAIFKILRNYLCIYKLDTIRKMVGRWAPPGDNNHTEAYIKAVSGYAGMSKVENGVEADMSDVITGWSLL